MLMKLKAYSENSFTGKDLPWFLDIQTVAASAPGAAEDPGCPLPPAARSG